MTTLEHITAIIEQYQKESKLSPDRLLLAQDKLTTYLYTFAEEVALAYEVYLQAKLDRKMGILEKQESLILEGMNKTDAGRKAETKSFELYEAENTADTNYKRYKMLLTQANEVTQAIRQRVSVLKKEKSNSEHGS